MNTQMIFAAIGAFIIGAAFCFFVMKLRLKAAERTANDLSREAKKNIEREKHQIILKAKEDWLRSRDEQEAELKKRAESLDAFESQTLDLEKSLNKREEKVRQKENQLLQRENDLQAQHDALKVKDEELRRIIYAQNEALSKVSNLSPEDAKQKLLQNLKKEYRHEAAEIYKSLVDEAKKNANREAKKIITYSIEKLASEYASENSLAVVSLPSEEVKGRIIGRDGRNIKSFETSAGVKLIVDDTPEAVVISCFDPVQREIARLALEKLISNGKIHPHRIEEVLKQSEQEVEKSIWRAGNEMVASISVGKIHPDLIRTLGKLHYRTSYGQNVLKHSKEVAMLCGAMAAELKLDPRLARRAGLMHDIGKAISQIQEGTHTQLGEQLCKKYNENPIVLNAIASHHEDVPADNLYSVLVAAADAISGSRPGARRDTLDGYVRRIENLEKLADSFDGVEKSYAISAGREVRVIVQPEKISDAEADLLSADIAKKIQNDLDYPGQVKVTVIRESKSIAYA
jgi:ribonuclease Y